MAFQVYPSDLSDDEWALLSPLIPAATANLRKVRLAGSESVVLNAPSSAACLSNLLQICSKPGGRPRSVAMRRILNGIFYVLRSGCAWRYLPVEYGPWPTVYYYLRRWRLDGTWEQIHTHLREVARLRAGRDPTPSAAIIDSQSVKTTEQGGPHGFDGAKTITGRKRRLLVDTEGLLLKVVVHPANLHDRLGAKLVLGALGSAFPRLRHIWADQGYSGALGEWSHEQLGIDLEVVYPW